jgi:hypothetical protein
VHGAAEEQEIFEATELIGETAALVGTAKNGVRFLRQR